MRKHAGAVLVLVVSPLLVATLAGGAARADTVDEPAEAIPSGPIPRARWYTLETPHFNIHFYPEERQFAERAAHIAERAYRLNTRYLNWRPSGRVDIVLNDQTDSANGFASSVPYPFIYAYGVPPDALEELNDFDDYVKLLITHEFTHVVHLDTILSWCPLVVDTVQGRTWAPNLSQPTWFVEGLAVLMESRQTTAGRLRSTFFDMHLRVPFIEGRLFGIDAASSIPLAYPGGTTVYLYGSNLLRYIEDRYGPEKIREISHRYADNCIPGGINRVAREAVGKGYVGSGADDDGLWDDWQRSLAHKITLEIEEAERRPLTPTRRLTFNPPGPPSEGPGARFFRDGTLVYHRSNDDQSPAYVRLDPATGAQQLLSTIQGGGPVSPTPDGRALIMQRIGFFPLELRISGASDAAWNDLYRLDLDSKAVRPLTRGYRAHEPDVSPDGTQIVCALAGPGSRKLAVVPIAGGAPRVLLPDAPGLVYSPTWSPDERLIVYSRWKMGGFRDIHVYDTRTGVDRALSIDRPADVDPRFTPDGRFIVFSSDRSGINNIYAYELASGQLFQVSNVLGGAFQPAVSPDGKLLVFTGFTSDGFDLFSMPFDPASFLPAQPFANARPDSPVNPDAETDSPDAAPEDAAAVPFAERVVGYAPWKYMYPKNWTLQFLTNPFGTGDAGRFTTIFGDPVGNHSVGLDLIFPTGGQPSVRATYSYNRLWPQLNFAFSRAEQISSGLVVGGVNTDYLQKLLTFDASIGLPVLRTADASGDISFGYDYSGYAPVNRVPVADPTAGISALPEIGPDTDVFASWSFSDAHSWPYSISPQEGRNVSANLRYDDPTIGSRFHATQVSWSWTEYMTPPWARLHALALLYGGGTGIGDKRSFFALGGYPAQDVLRSLILNQRACCFFLRGYPVGVVSGDSYQLFSAEYRAPLLWIERGYSTFPLYLRRVWTTVFTDAGSAYSGPFKLAGVKADAGAEVHLRFALFYYLDSEVQLGYAHGFESGGGDHFYFVTSASF